MNMPLCACVHVYLHAIPQYADRIEKVCFLELHARQMFKLCHACHRRRPGAMLRFQGYAVAARRAKRVAASQSGAAKLAVCLHLCA